MIISAFCGTGKTYLVDNSDRDLIELECWKYDKEPSVFPANFVEDVKLHYGKRTIFISTNQVVLEELLNQYFDITLVYPEITLKDEYMRRLIERGSPADFIQMLSTHWYGWLKEVATNNRCRHFVLASGQYISTVLPGDTL